MSRTIRFALAVALAAGSMVGGVAPAGATQCTPKGCSGGCTVGDLRDARVDLDTMTVELPRPIECYN